MITSAQRPLFYEGFDIINLKETFSNIKVNIYFENIFGRNELFVSLQGGQFGGQTLSYVPNNDELMTRNRTSVIDMPNWRIAFA